MSTNFSSLRLPKRFSAAALASVLSYLGLRDGLSAEQILLVTGPLYVFIGSQGMADLGKERARIIHAPTEKESSQ